MSTEKKEIFLKDYTAPPYLVDEVHLHFDLEESATRVTSRLVCRQSGTDNPPFELNGEHLEFKGVEIDSKPMGEGEYTYEDGVLTILKPPAGTFTLEVETVINPVGNTALEGLYLSSGNFCTQCEAEGFRRITCFPDRPDVMAVFTTTITADRDKYPVLLSNGNLVDSGELDNGRHFAVWHDPFKKPCYLFALVAGNLVCIEDEFITMSGRKVDLRIYVEERNKEKCDHAMASLKKSMKWDEEVFGREYDLDIYMIVAVDDFNMGAMENKGLNVFNSKYVLASPKTATDTDYDGIEGVIAHEYFHNWTGNRVTCRDWFQLSLKEGLTVFRDQEFSSDMTSRAVKRIQDVNIIRSFQFREDNGPMAHPVRPASFVEINNFYTLTVYNKGAEVIRMMHTLLGADGFRKGMDLYFERHDGQAVTCDDFIRSMEDANGMDLTRFKRWYSQAGTPTLKVEEEWDEQAGTYTVHIEQTCPVTPETKDKQPFYMPVSIGLIDRAGNALAPKPLSDQATVSGEACVLKLSAKQQDFVFSGLTEKPVLSFLRDFSAPVKVTFDRPVEETSLLMARDSNAFTRWDAGQELILRCILEQIEDYAADNPIEIDEQLKKGIEGLISDTQSDPALLAMALTLPSENWISQQLEVVDPVVVHSVHKGLSRGLANLFGDLLLERYNQLASDQPYQYSPEETGRRALRNRCLAYLLATDPSTAPGKQALELGREQYAGSDNMTDRMAALNGVVNADPAAGQELLADFYDQWKSDPLVMDKWLAIQAGCTLPGTLDRVRKLMEHETFSIRNPNKVRALVATFCSLNHAQFHAADGSGYVFLGDFLLDLDPLNPQIAARLCTPFTQWRRYDGDRGLLIKKQLERLGGTEHLSGDLREITTRSLGQS